jgi:glycosyltransferase involved in cell wall biosynthesis
VEILHILGTLDLGGAEQLVMDLALAQSKMGLDVAVATIAQPQTSALDYDVWLRRQALLADAGIPNLALARTARSIIPASHQLSRWQNQFDLVHAHSIGGVLVYRLSSLRGAPVVWTLHATKMNFPVGAIKFTQPLVTSYVGCSQAVTDAFQPFIRKRITTVENGIRLSDFAPTPSRKMQSPSRFEFLSVGAFRRSKNYPRLVQAATIAAGRLEAIGVKMRLRIVGEGSERSAIEEAVRVHSRGREIELLGSRTDVRELLMESDAFVLASDVEGLPLSLMEAMAAELPCVVTPFSFAKEKFRTGEDALIATQFTADALADAMFAVASDEDLAARLSRASARIARQFDISRCASDYTIAYSHALGGD